MKFFLIVFFITSIANAHSIQNKKQIPNYFIPKEELEEKKEVLDNKRPEAQASYVKSDFLEQSTQQQQDFASSPEYTEIYEEYIKDINHIAKSGEYSDTSQIQKDFTGMHTNEQFLVE